MDLNNTELKQVIANIAFPGNKGYTEDGMLIIVDYSKEGHPEHTMPFDPFTHPAIIMKFMDDMNISLIMKGHHCWAEGVNPTIPGNEERVRMSQVLPKTMKGRAVCEAVIKKMELVNLHKQSQSDAQARVQESMKTSSLLISRAGKVTNAKDESGDVGIILQ